MSHVDISRLLRHGDHLYAAGVLYQAEWDSYEALVRNPLTVSSSAPECQLLTPAGGTFAIGASVPIRWNARDDRGVRSVDLLLSRSGPNGPWEPIAVGLVNTGDYLWTVQGPECPSVAHLRVDARDYDRNVGSVVGPAAFSIFSPATPTLVDLQTLEASEAGIEIRWSLDRERVQGPGMVERRTDLGEDWVPVNGEPTAQHFGFSLLDRMVAAGQTYWYRVVAPLLGGGSVSTNPQSIAHAGAVARLALAMPSPNPSPGSTELRFEIPSHARVRLGIFDLQGREVARLIDKEHQPGRHTARLEAGDIAPGMYLLRLQSGGMEARRKLVLTR